MQIPFWRAPLKGHAAPHLMARVVTLAMLAVTLAMGTLLVRPSSAHAQVREQQMAGLQGSTTVQTATDIPRTDVFARGPDGGLWHRWFFNGWHDWENLGRHLDSAPAATRDPVDPGVIDVFYRDGIEIWRGRIALSGSWISWEDLGRECEHGFGGFCYTVFASAPAATSSLQQGPYTPGHLEIFALGDAHHLWHKWLNPIYSTFGLGIVGYSWSDWALLSEADFSGDPAAVSWGAGRVDVFVHGLDDDHLWQKTYDGNWHDWQDLGGTIFYSPAAASIAPGHLDVFVIGTDHQMWTRSYSNGQWSGYAPLGGYIIASPSANSRGDQHYDVVVLGGDNQYYHSWWGGQLAPYTPIGVQYQFSSAPAVVLSLQSV